VYINTILKLVTSVRRPNYL